jgi:hypothetical protein
MKVKDGFGESDPGLFTGDEVAGTNGEDGFWPEGAGLEQRLAVAQAQR